MVLYHLCGIWGSSHKENSKQCCFLFKNGVKCLFLQGDFPHFLSRFSSFGATWTFLLVSARAGVTLWLFHYQATQGLSVVCLPSPVKREKENKDRRKMQSPGQVEQCLALQQPSPSKVRTAHPNDRTRYPSRGDYKSFLWTRRFDPNGSRVALLTTGHQWWLVNSHNETTPAEWEKEIKKKATRKIHEVFIASAILREKYGFKRGKKWEAIQEDQHEMCMNQLNIKQLGRQKQDSNGAKGQGSWFNCPLGTNQCGRQMTREKIRLKVSTSLCSSCWWDRIHPWATLNREPGTELGKRSWNPPAQGKENNRVNA